MYSYFVGNLVFPIIFIDYNNNYYYYYISSIANQVTKRTTRTTTTNELRHNNHRQLMRIGRMASRLGQKFREAAMLRPASTYSRGPIMNEVVK